MRGEPDELSGRVLADALDRRWGIAGGHLDHVPVGFGGHHWRAVGGDGSRWFVSADDLRALRHGGRDPDVVFAALDRAFRTAAVLGGAGLEFVLAPVPDGGGDFLVRVGDRYAVRVEPFVDGTVEESGDFKHPDDRRRVAALLGSLHAASGSVPPDLPGREGFALPGRDELEAALAQLGTPWDGGPFAEPARRLLARHAESVRDRLGAYDLLAGRVRDEAGDWVVTHGEPHSANVVRDAEGDLRLVDWDTTLVAPRERDLWMVLDEAMTGWDEYRAAAGSVALNDDALGLYRERWALAEICEYVSELRRPHEETDDTRASWAILGEYLP